MREFLMIAKSLSDKNRVRALLALYKYELCLCQIVELLHLAPSTVSKHLSILKNANLVDNRKDGRWVYYRTARGTRNEFTACAIDWVYKSLKGTSHQKKDASRLKQILMTDPEVLCMRQVGTRKRNLKRGIRTNNQ